MSEAYLHREMGMTVTWGDCDAAGISYYARNFEWFTDARMQFFADTGFPYMETFQNQGISLVCLKADCNYKKMLRPLEKIKIRTTLSVLTRSRLAFAYQVLKENGELAAEGMTSHAYVDDDGKPFNLKKRFPELWEKMSEIYLQNETEEG
ncbi:acyl-CoA thioesterase [Virgibacillus sp. 179-BFC.A HS]|uniref:Acyl-CoA thioesterase n=1 Tax=Tigheibacillus jepli TaxID=3035914 RepID=A0ABU5CMN9_9BACI|nr:acyl-CoA thioesterase [Virgibacillus sp. 179-BFC.A HS]MDY0407097.1 acyl-CoA thioesterase [Virgibacillus sp. 179-BFC.A HS]